MNFNRDSVRSIGWAFVLTLCAVPVAALTLRVNAVKGKVHETEKQMVSLQREIVFLETEFKTRANQQQLKALNDVEFGYKAPRAAQYIEGEPPLASLGGPRAPGAPEPIRVANAEVESADSPLLALVSPLTGQPAAAHTPDAADSVETGQSSPHVPAQATGDIVGDAIEAADLDERLGRIELPGTDEGQ